MQTDKIRSILAFDHLVDGSGKDILQGDLCLRDTRLPSAWFGSREEPYDSVTQMLDLEDLAKCEDIDPSSTGAAFSQYGLNRILPVVIDYFMVEDRVLAVGSSYAGSCFNFEIIRSWTSTKQSQGNQSWNLISRKALDDGWPIIVKFRYEDFEVNYQEPTLLFGTWILTKTGLDKTYLARLAPAVKAWYEKKLRRCEEHKAWTKKNWIYPTLVAHRGSEIVTSIDGIEECLSISGFRFDLCCKPTLNSSHEETLIRCLK